MGIARNARTGREIGGRLEVWSEVNGGTEVELSVPAQIAYGMSFTPTVVIIGETVAI